MRATNTPFNAGDPSESVARMKTILDASDGAFEEKDSIPPAESLTYDNGFYVNCSALFIDIRGSSNLPDTHTRPVLAKIYRSYISEAVAVMNSNPNCREVVINGDCVSAILDTPWKRDINTAFETAATLNSLVNILNWQLEKKSYTPIRCGIGLAWGRALMLKAGFKGSGINDIVWMGDVVNEASKLCERGNKLLNKAVQVSADVRYNLSDEYKGYLTMKYDADLQAYRYEGGVINIVMEKWLTEQKEKERRDAQTRAYVSSLFASIPVRPPSGGLAGALLAQRMGSLPLPPVHSAKALMSLAEMAALAYPPEPKSLGVLLSEMGALAYLPKR